DEAVAAVHDPSLLADARDRARGPVDRLDVGDRVGQVDDGTVRAAATLSGVGGAVAHLDPVVAGTAGCEDAEAPGQARLGRDRVVTAQAVHLDPLGVEL